MPQFKIEVRTTTSETETHLLTADDLEDAEKKAGEKYSFSVNPSDDYHRSADVVLVEEVEEVDEDF